MKIYSRFSLICCYKFTQNFISFNSHRVSIFYGKKISNENMSKNISIIIIIFLNLKLDKASEDWIFLIHLPFESKDNHRS